VEAKKVIVVVIDGSDSARAAAEALSAALGAYEVRLKRAETFEGTDLLAARAFFLGAETPNPPSFGYLAEMLAHINLANRPCGVFAANGEALEYLAALVKDSEAALGEPLLVQGEISQAELLKWLKSILI
jgi:hypothetical protein